jgi:hypothetical protein
MAPTKQSNPTTPPMIPPINATSFIIAFPFEIDSDSTLIVGSVTESVDVEFDRASVVDAVVNVVSVVGGGVVVVVVVAAAAVVVLVVVGGGVFVVTIVDVVVGGVVVIGSVVDDIDITEDVAMGSHSLMRTHRQFWEFPQSCKSVWTSDKPAIKSNPRSQTHKAICITAHL